MKISGTSTLNADRVTVWAALNDPAVLVQTIPGCQQLEALGDDAFKMTVAAGVGSIKGVYDGQVRLTDHQHPEAFKMHAQGAGAPGTIGAEVWVNLIEGPDGRTELKYDADATVGGMIGGVGQRMLTGVSKKMADEFFRNVDAVLVGGLPAAPTLAASRSSRRSGSSPGTGGRTHARAPGRPGLHRPPGRRGRLRRARLPPRRRGRCGCGPGRRRRRRLARRSQAQLTLR